MDASYLDLVMAQQEETLEEAHGEGGIWVVAEVVKGQIAPVTLEAVGAARELADSLGAYVYGVLLGHGVFSLSDPLYQAGADGIRVIEHRALASFSSDPYTEILVELFDEEVPELILLGATEAGLALGPRLAQRLGGGLMEEVVAINLEETTRAVKVSLPVYGGEYFDVRVCREARPQILSIKPGAFAKPFLDEYRRGEPTVRHAEPVEPRVRVHGPAEEFEAPQVALSDAAVVVAAGRQAGGLEPVEKLAEALQAHLAGDRGAWDAGWIDSEQIVDVRGVKVCPDVYVAVGIRGDTFHNAAIEGSNFVVAIHPDPDAPILDVADLCVVGEPEEVLPAVVEALR